MIALPLRYQLIKDIVDEYERRFPEELKEVARSARKMRGSRANVFGADKAMEFRFALRLPNKLWRLFEKLVCDPCIFHDDAEFNWFMKKFPQYRVPEKS